MKVIGGGQLGDEAQLLENMKIGTVDCAGSSVGNIGGHIPKAGLLGVPTSSRTRSTASGSPRAMAASSPRSPPWSASRGDWRALGMTTAGTRSVYNSVRRSARRRTWRDSRSGS